MATAQLLPFGALLRRARRTAGMTQQALAQRAGYSQVYVGMLERGERIPLPATVELLADALDVGPAERAALRSAAQRMDGQAPARHRTSQDAPSGPRAVVDVTPAASALSAPPQVPSLVGRKRELDWIDQLLLGQGRPLLFFEGEPGIGKTRLLQEAARRGAERGWTVLTGRCQRGGQEPYAPLLDALATHIRGQSRERLRVALEGCAWLVRLLPELAELAVVPAPSWTLPPEQEQRLMFAAVGRYLDNVAGPMGTLLILDDLQWVGVDTLDLFRALDNMMPERLRRVVGAYQLSEVRPDHSGVVFLGDLAQEGLAVQETIGPLSWIEAGELLDQLVAPTAWTDPAARARVLRRAGGVPFYLISFAQGVRSGALRGDPAGDGVPWDIAQTIRRRVAALPVAAQAMLHITAVAIREVPRTLLVAVAARLGMDERDALEGLDAACRARLLAEESEETYVFAHDLIREVVAADLGAGQRARLHHELAAALERAPDGWPDEALAYHHAECGEREEAFVYLERAGARALALGAHGQAEQDYRGASELAQEAGDQPHAAEALENLANVLFTVARFDQALDVLDQAAAIYRAAGDVEGEERVLAQMGQVHIECGSPQEGVDLLSQRLPELEKRGLSARGRADLSLVLGHLLYASGRYQRMQVAINRATQLAHVAHDQVLLGRVEVDHGTVLQLLGRMDKAARVQDMAARLCESTGNLRDLHRALNSLGEMYVRWGEYKRARRRFDRAHEVAEQMGELVPIVFAWYCDGVVAYHLGDWPRARQDLERAVAALDETGRTWFSASAHAALGALRLAEGRSEDGARHLAEAIALAEHDRDLQALWQAHTTLAERELLEGRVEDACTRLDALLGADARPEEQATSILPIAAWAHLAAGDAARAEALLLEGIVRATSRKLRPVLVDALRVQVSLDLRREMEARARSETRLQRTERAPTGQRRREKPPLEQALRLSRTMGDAYTEAKALYVAGLRHYARGERERARRRYQQAAVILDRLGERLYAELVERALATLPEQVGAGLQGAPRDHRVDPADLGVPSGSPASGAGEYGAQTS